MTINRRLILSLTCLALAACGGEEAPVEEPVVAEQPVASSEVVAETEEVSEETVTQFVAEMEEASVETATQIVQAPPQTPIAARRFEEGRHYVRIAPAQPTVGDDDKIEVAEVFWYGCPHCYSLKPTMVGWAAQAPSNVRVVRIPATWNNQAEAHAQIYYTMQVLARDGAIADGEAFHTAVFDEVQNRGNNLMREEAIMRFFARFGVDESEFERAWGSFEVAQRLQIARDLTRRYGAASVPAIVVNGQYRTAPGEAGGPEALVDLIDELVARVSAR